MLETLSYEISQYGTYLKTLYFYYIMSSNELMPPMNPGPEPLVYPDTTGCSQLLLIESSIQEPSVMANAVNDKTLPVTFGWSSTKADLLALLRSKFTTIDRIAIAFSCQKGPTQPFMDNEVFFNETESVPYSDNVYFIISLVKEFQVKQIDYLGCNTLQYAPWNHYYSILKEETGIIVGASNDQTGNIKYGGDWTLESTGQDIESVYFTQNIDYYQYVLDSFITTITSSGAGGFIDGVVYNNILYYKNSTNNYVSKMNATNGVMITSQFINVSLIGGGVMGQTSNGDNAMFVSSTNIFIVQGTYLVKYDLSGNGSTIIYTSSNNYSRITGTDSVLYYLTVDNDGLNLTRLVKLNYDGSVIYKFIISNSANSGLDSMAMTGNYIYTWRPIEKQMYKINISGSTPYIENYDLLNGYNWSTHAYGKEVDTFQIYGDFLYLRRSGLRIDKVVLSTGQPDSPNQIWQEFIPGNSVWHFTIGDDKLYIFRNNNTYSIYQLYQPFSSLAEEVTIVCFKEDSLILTDQGYRPVQDLRKGDLVRTEVNGYVPVYMIGKKEIHHPASKERIKDQLYECNPTRYPELFEPLIITGCHCILVDDVLSDEQLEKAFVVNGGHFSTNQKYRLPSCVDERATVYDKPGAHTIYHFALEHDDYYSNYGVYANGLLVETCSKRYLTELAHMELIE